MSLRPQKVLVLTGIASALAAGTAFAASSISDGPNTSTSPYVVPVADGVHIKSLLTVDDPGSASNGYEMVGIPDGIGARNVGDGRIEVFMNHELRITQGIERRHGQKGAFVSKLRINPANSEVTRGSDLINPGVRFWDYPTREYQTDVPSSGGVNPRDPTDTFIAQSPEFARFCSGSLSRQGQLLNGATGRGYAGQLYFANEESGDEGRVFGVTTLGDAYQLPRLGLFSWEQTIVATTTGDRTVVMGNEDASTGQIWVYSGVKQRTGNAVQKAGLTNGRNFVMDLEDETVDSDAEFRATFGKGTPAPFDIGDAEEVDWDRSGARQNAEAAAAGLTLNRIEDGAFDPRNPNDYWFLTTEGAPGVTPEDPNVTRDGGGVWRMRFNDVSRPSLGGTLTLMLDGSEAPFLNKPDNMDIDGQGNLLIQEDPGNNASLARIVAYDIDTADRGVVARFDPALFRPGAAGFIAQDEESSGIIDARSTLGQGMFIFDAQVHAPPTNNVEEYVERGQLLTMRVTDWSKVYDIDGDAPDVPLAPPAA